MEYILKNGIVYDPANNVAGEKKDVMFKDGKIVDNVSSDAKILDVTDKIVMPAGVDPHAHVAGPKLVTGRIYRPEDSRKGVTAKKGVCRSESGFSIPSCPATGYRYSRMGYGTVTEAAVPPLEAKHTHEEIMAIPNVDVTPLPLFGNNWFVLQYVKEGQIEEIAAFISSWLKIVKGYGIKIVNPCGSEAWGWGMNVHGIDDPAPYWDVTGREMVRALSQANEMLGLPHSIHVHPNDLGHPGNFPTTVGTMDCVKDVEKNSSVRNQTIHITHAQFHSYGGTSWRDAESGAGEVADYVNKNKHVTCDVGQVTLDETTTMTADAPMEYDLSRLNGLKWANKDIELETAAGLVPFIYSGKAPVSSLQWAIGLELFLLVNDPSKVCITTDSPNAGPFTRYPRVMSWLMSEPYRTDLIENKVHKWAQRKSSIATIDREYTFMEIAQITRSTPAKVLGLSETKGHLGAGADADIAIYNFNPETQDPSTDYMTLEAALQKADYVFKDGEVVVKDGSVVNTKLHGRTYWVDTQTDETIYKEVLSEVEKTFKQYYSVNFQNYPVQEDYLPKSAPVKGVML